ncbi:S-adenosyl-L-methionine-dependent methyltransferase [Lecanosticta acicola]|uniref:S-adenosyl-L-methionine-dependent methyltransferase n=1 Tax=Lecanosticta acicola TaxID=111012 RepID=A0AAI8W294_9PEZI|nr:S-adenosyl-L-methionine-dependent methyltransferase [Lecanosticta acicola]
MSVVDILQGLKDHAAESEANGGAVAHARLLEGIHQLRLAAETPAEKLMRMRFEINGHLCVRLAIEYGLLQAIAAMKGSNITAAGLAQETGCDELLIIRIMRLVTYQGICKETGYASYASNDTTEAITTKGFMGGEKHHTDLGFAVGSKLVEQKRKEGLHQFPEGPGERSPFEYTFGMPLFEYLKHDQEQKEAFHDYMAARRDPRAPQWFQIYPAIEQLSDGLKADNDAALVVDIGGGFGHELSKFQQSFPNLLGKLILQDLQVTFDGLQTKPKGIQLMPYDFFTEQPVRGSRLYFFRNIMHDWSDKKCRAILSNTVKAMDPKYSRILIDDYVLPDTGADLRAASMDVLMMIFASGMERTRHQWEELLGSVGLEIVKVWSHEAGVESVIEAKMRD